MQVESASFDVQAAIQKVCESPNPLIAFHAFKENQEILKDWRIIYAAEDDSGPFKLKRSDFFDRGIVSTCFRGKSIWILDSDAINTEEPVRFQMGYGTYVDSNAASFIKAFAYRENPSQDLVLRIRALKEKFSCEELSTLNPFLYLWEAQRFWTPQTIENSRMTVAAIHALSLDDSPLDDSWGLRFRQSYRIQSETHAENLIKDFQGQLGNGLHAALEQQLNIIESMLLRTKIIEASSSKSSEHKMEELLQFMHEELSTFMLRELIVCADILCRGEQSSLSKKLNSVIDKKDPIGFIQNCAWDLYLPRAMDFMSNTMSMPEADFYLASLVTFDKDVADIFKLTELKAMAIDRKSTMTLPFFNEEFVSWLVDRVGMKRLNSLGGIFQQQAFELRAGRRSNEAIKAIVDQDRSRFLAMKTNK